MLKTMWDDIVYQFKTGSILLRLIFFMIGLFLCLETFHFIMWSMGDAELYYKTFFILSLPGNFSALATQPWSALTFMVIHEDVWHILYNLLWLYWFGEIYQLYMFQKRLMPIFIFGSLAGGLLYMLCAFLPPLRMMSHFYLAGSSAGLFAIMFAATALNPDHDVNLLFAGRVSIKYVAFLALLISFLTIPRGNPGGMISHIGGAIFGFGYIRSLRAGVDWFAPLDWIANLFKRGPKLKATHVKDKPSDQAKKGPGSDVQKRLDEILDKISRSGYNSLSKEEKEFLFKFSNK